MRPAASGYIVASFNCTHKRLCHTALYDRETSFAWAVRSAQTFFTPATFPVDDEQYASLGDHVARVWLASLPFQRPDGLGNVRAGDPLFSGFLPNCDGPHAPVEDAGFHAALVCSRLCPGLGGHSTGQCPESLRLHASSRPMMTSHDYTHNTFPHIDRAVTGNGASQ